MKKRYPMAYSVWGAFTIREGFRILYSRPRSVGCFLTRCHFGYGLFTEWSEWIDESSDCSLEICVEDGCRTCTIVRESLHSGFAWEV